MLQPTAVDFLSITSQNAKKNSQIDGEVQTVEVRRLEFRYRGSSVILSFSARELTVMNLIQEAIK